MRRRYDVTKMPYGDCSVGRHRVYAALRHEFALLLLGRFLPKPGGAMARRRLFFGGQHAGAGNQMQRRLLGHRQKS